MPRTRSGDTTTGRATRAAPAARVSRRLRTTALATVLAVVVAPFVALGTAVPAAAAITTPFTSVFSANTNGDIVMAANTLMTCADAEPDCAAAQDAESGNYSNNDHAGMHFVDDDGPANTTFNSSSATLTVPDGGAVLFAALVWGGRNGKTATSHANRSLAGNVRLFTPDAVDHPVTATTLNDNFVATGNADVAYSGYADVTNIVKQAGTGKYTVADVQSKEGTNQYAGWALVVAVSNPAAPMRNLTIFSGFGEVTNSGSAKIDVSGFMTPPTGAVNTTLGAVTFEGDMGLVNDSMSLNTTPIADDLNPATNAFNSTISNRGQQVTGRSPSYHNQLGFDADLFAADGILKNGATSASINLTTSGDQYFPAMVSFATELYDPKLLGTKKVENLTRSGSAKAGDLLRYTVPVDNIGLDAASNSVFFDAVPTGTTYVEDSVTVDGQPQTDDVDTDNTVYVGPSGSAGQGHIQVNLGTGATPTRGGTIPVATKTVPYVPQHVVTFDVTVDASVTNGQELVNAASLVYSGYSTHAANASATNAVLSPVVAAEPAAGNLPPVAPAHLATFAPTAAQPTSTISVLTGASDPEGLPLTLVGLTDAAGGSVTIVGNTVIYAPRADFAGRDVFTYTIRDSAGNQATNKVQVEVLNSPPVAADDAVSVKADFTTAVDVLVNDTDPNDDARTIRSVRTTTPGATVEVTGGKVSYTPPLHFRGTDTFTYVVEDSRGASDEATVTVTVTNNAPVAVADSFTGTAGSTLSFTSVLANDSDVEADALTAVKVTGPAYGTLTLAADGTGTWDPGTSGFLTTTFTYKARDGVADSNVVTVTLTVRSRPVAVADTATAPSGTAVDVDVLHNDSHPDGSPLTLVSATPGTSGTTAVVGGVVRYTPDAGYAGTDTFTYTIGDGWSTKTATVTVTVLNSAPVASPPSTTTPYGTSVTVDLLAGATDLNPGDVLTVVPGSAGVPVDVHGTPRGSVAVTGGVATYTPPAGFSGQVLFTYDVTDGTDVTTVTAVVTVQNGTLAPGSATKQVTRSGQTVLDVLAGLQDPDGGTLTLVSVTQPAHGTVAIVDGKLVYTPEPGWTGTATFTYTVSDGQGGTTTSTLSLDVVAEVLATGPLATTGASGIGTLAGLGGLLVLAGLVLVVVVGRRRTTA